ncbi:hypothetical protein [Ornithinimicrobium flavum]|uniref:hypothetical protein n=1 Tax=Ornithinimicrobium flavum TaxID=1288636 RepID=UPI0010703B45|nr:hypothetical protein [Ornithinimicrobium flavum]
MGGLTPGQHEVDGPAPRPGDAGAVPVARRWAADPLPLLLLLGGVGLGVAVLAATGGLTGTVAWVVPALFAVVVAGLALSGST